MIAPNPGIPPGPCPLTPEEHNAAWLVAYRTNLEALPDDEVRWERNVWDAAGEDRLVAVCDALLIERSSTLTTIPGGAEAADLNCLFARVDRQAAGRLIGHEALTVVEAMRLVFWTTLREVPR